MKLHPGDKLVCSSDGCNTEITIDKSCNCNRDGSLCEIEATCCDQPMIKSEDKEF